MQAAPAAMVLTDGRHERHQAARSARLLCY
jgi:hypothetical protein